jgi:hypothetical protein
MDPYKHCKSNGVLLFRHVFRQNKSSLFGLMKMSSLDKAKKKAEEDKKRAEAAKKEYVEKTTKKME